jgi:hypothetical protein
MNFKPKNFGRTFSLGGAYNQIIYYKSRPGKKKMHFDFGVLEMHLKNA